MNINTSPDAISRSSVNITPGYMSGFGNSFETEALPGALADRAQLAAALRLRALRRAAVRLAVHRAARQQRALVAVSDPAVGQALRPVRQGRCRAVAHRAVPRAGDAGLAIALGPGADPDGPT